jgi:hypothetical protein
MREWEAKRSVGWWANLPSGPTPAAVRGKLCSSYCTHHIGKVNASNPRTPNVEQVNKDPTVHNVSFTTFRREQGEVQALFRISSMTKFISICLRKVKTQNSRFPRTNTFYSMGLKSERCSFSPSA